MLARFILPQITKTNKSILLFGPRQVGKSTLISSLECDLSINLANEIDYMTHSSQPQELEKLITLSSAKTIFIDEVQRLPRLLNTVQALVDKNKSLKFYLTGSSARKLKRGGANLLPGRVLNFKMGPLIASEMSYKFETKKILGMGSLPEIYLEKSATHAHQILQSYAANYLQEEIKAEALTRDLEAFSRFLSEVSLSVGQFIDHSKIAKKIKISRHSVPRYFEILEDTMVGYRIFPFEELTDSEDLIRHPKFYLFDNGVYNGLLQNFVPSPDRIGALAEQLVFSQITHSCWAQNQNATISTFRTRTGVEVDFILKRGNSVVAIEVKTNDNVSADDCDSLIYFGKKAKANKRLFIFHMGTKESKMGPVWSLPWQKGLAEIGL